MSARTGYEGRRRFVIEETHVSGRKLWFFDATSGQLLEVIATVEQYNQYDSCMKRRGDGFAKLYIAAEFLRAYGCTEDEEELYIGRSMQRDEGLEIVTSTAMEAASGLESSWKARLP